MGGSGNSDSDFENGAPSGQAKENGVSLDYELIYWYILWADLLVH